MKYLLNLALFTLFPFFVFSQSYQWAHEIEFNNPVGAGKGMKIDSKGDIILYSSGESTISFNDTTVVPVLYLSKFDSTGHSIWIKSIKGTSFAKQFLYNLQEGSIVIDVNDNIYISGSLYDYTGNLLFDSLEVTLNSFIAKYNSKGELIWIRPVAADLTGHDHLAVNTQGEVFFTAVSNYETNSDTNFLHVPGSFYLGKLNSKGEYSWVKAKNNFSSGSLNQVIALDKEEHIFLGGNHTIPGNFIIDGIEIFSEGLGRFSLLKFSPDGHLISGKLLGNIDYSFLPQKLDIDINGKIWMINNLTTSIDFKFQVDKFESENLNHLFTKPIFDPTSPTGGNAYDLSLNSKGEGYMCGNFIGDISINNIIYHSIERQNNSYILKMDANGEITWFKQSANSEKDLRINAIAVNHKGELYTTGSFVDGYFDNIHLQKDSLNHPYLAKLNDDSMVTSINESSLAPLPLNVYPNPSNGEVNLFIKPGSGVNSSLVVLNTLGQIILEEKNITENQTYTFHLSQGIYQYVLSSDKGNNVSGKIMVK